MNSRQALSSRRAHGAVLGLTTVEGKVFYPVSQLRRRGTAVDVHPSLLPVLRELKSVDSWTVAAMLNSADPDGGCWWFSSSGDGPFDLDDPLGTCYLGETEGVAARERCGRLMAMHLPITKAIYLERVVSEVLPPSADRPMADLTDPGALTAGVTGEFFTSRDYAQGKAWAHACWDAGFGGLRYPPRFTPGGSERAFAVFGGGGSQPDRGVVRRRSLLEVLQHLGYPTIRSDEPTSDTLHDQDDAAPGAS